MLVNIWAALATLGFFIWLATGPRNPPPAVMIAVNANDVAFHDAVAMESP